MEDQLNFWRAKIESWPISLSVKAGLIEYAVNLTKSNLPVIFEFGHLANHLSVNPQILADAVNRTEKSYRNFNLPKRRGGTREINVPSPSLLEMQRWILENILEKIQIGSCAYGFVKGRGIVDNAAQHIGAKNMVKLDIKDFFPSIKLARVISVFNKAGYLPNISYYLAKLCTLNNSLPQGGATSPYLSNIIAKRMDARISGFCKNQSLVYTRYADDITVSGAKITRSVERVVESIVRSEGFFVNEAKTVLIGAKGKKIVTGILVGDDGLRIPKNYKRKLRQELYYVERYGIENHMEKIGHLDPMYIDRLRGRLAFVRSVEPDLDLVFIGVEILDKAEKQI